MHCMRNMKWFWTQPENQHHLNMILYIDCTFPPFKCQLYSHVQIFVAAENKTKHAHYFQMDCVLFAVWVTALDRVSLKKKRKENIYGAQKKSRDGVALFSWQASGSFQSPQQWDRRTWWQIQQLRRFTSCEYGPAHMDDAEIESPECSLVASKPWHIEAFCFQHWLLFVLSLFSYQCPQCC